jgi:hypothetical protein
MIPKEELVNGKQCYAIRYSKGRTAQVTFCTVITQVELYKIECCELLSEDGTDLFSMPLHLIFATKQEAVDSAVNKILLDIKRDLNLINDLQAQL